MNCIFNELSFAEYVDSFPKLLPALKELNKFHLIGTHYGQDTFIHRDGFYGIKICGQDFRQAVNLYIRDKEDKRIIFRLLDKTPRSLPDNTAIPDGCRCYHNNCEISCTGLAECAFRQFMGEKSLAYSLPSPTYMVDPLRITLATEGHVATEVRNVTSIESFRKELEHNEPAISTWNDIFQRAERLLHLRFETSAYESLAREPFEVSLGNAIWERLVVIEKISTSSDNDYTELTRKYCHGDTAIFSDESRTRINELGEKLYFSVNGKRTLCSFHGKIPHRFFRIHMDMQPVPGNIITIVHIGQKIL